MSGVRVDQAAPSARYTPPVYDDAADLPPRYRQRHLGEYPADVRNRVAEWMHGPRWCLYLWGGLGSGKTSLACAIVRAWRGGLPVYQRSTAAVFAPVDVAARMLRAQTAWFVERCREWPLLVLDDLGASRGTEHLVEQLGHILFHRYDQNLKTVLTSNVSHADLERIDPRLADRLRDGEIIQTSGDSLRGTL